MLRLMLNLGQTYRVHTLPELSSSLLGVYLGAVDSVLRYECYRLRHLQVLIPPLGRPWRSADEEVYEKYLLLLYSEESTASMLVRRDSRERGF